MNTPTIIQLQRELEDLKLQDISSGERKYDGEEAQGGIQRNEYNVTRLSPSRNRFFRPPR